MIPLSVPNLSGNEWKYIKDCLDTNWVSSVGSYVTKFEQVTAEYTGAKYAIATSNGTSAIQISLLLAGVKRDDLVIAPNITFVASVNAIKYIGANPILIDINTDNWQMDLDLLEDFLINHTTIENNTCIYKVTKQVIRAILPVHVLGNICDMDKLVSLANTYCLNIVEDSTEALGSYYKGRHAGTIGKFGTLSYNGNKLITTGGGGMILTDDEVLAKKAKHLTTQAKSKSDEYFHDEVGYNFRLVNILAAMGVAQMEQLSIFLNSKSTISNFYNSRLSNIEGFVNQEVLSDVKTNCWLYTVKLPRAKQLLAHFKELKIEARPFWIPMNQLPANVNNIYYTRTDISNSVYENCVSLPCSTGISDNELKTVVKTIQSFYES
jgi:perosamine synthetase